MAQLIATSTGLEHDDFEPREQAYGEDEAHGRWARMDFVDQGQVVLSLDDVDADVYVFDGKVTQFGTRRSKLLLRKDLPSYVGGIWDKLIAHGFELERQTPGDFLRTSTDEPVVRAARFVRGDFAVLLSLSVPPDWDKFGLQVGGSSDGACLPPAQIEDRRRHQDELDRDLPRVKPLPREP